MRPSDTRGQSETLGTMLLVGVITVAITLGGGAAAANYLSQASVEEPLVDLEIEYQSGDGIHIQHLSGEALGTETTAVIVDGSQRGTLADAESFHGDEDGRFQLGESATFSSPISDGAIEVLVVDQETNTIVEREEILVDELDDELTVEDFESPAEAEQDEEISISATIAHDGDAELEQDVEFAVDESIQDIESVTLDDGASEDVSFSYTIPEDEESESITVTVATNNDNERADVTVLEVGELTVEDFESPAEAEQDEEITVSATIVHDGDVDLEQAVGFAVDGSIQDIESVTLDDGASEDVSFSYTIPEDEESESITVTIETGDDVDSGEISLRATGEIRYEPGSAESSAGRGLFDVPDSVLEFELENTYRDEIEIIGFETTGPAEEGGIERTDIVGFGGEEIIVDAEDRSTREGDYFEFEERVDLDQAAIVAAESTAEVTIREYRDSEDAFNRYDISGEELTITVYYTDPDGDEQTAELTFTVDED